MTDEEATKKGSPLPWHTEKERGSDIYDATGIFVLSVWWQEAKFIVERVNAHDDLRAEISTLRAELQAAADTMHLAGNQLTHESPDAAARLLNQWRQANRALGDTHQLHTTPPTNHHTTEA